MTYLFHPEAEVEFNNAIDYYEECREALGLEFASEVYQTQMLGIHLTKIIDDA